MCRLSWCAELLTRDYAEGKPAALRSLYLLPWFDHDFTEEVDPMPPLPTAEHFTVRSIQLRAYTWLTFNYFLQTYRRNMDIALLMVNSNMEAQSETTPHVLRVYSDSAQLVSQLTKNIFTIVDNAHDADALFLTKHFCDYAYVPRIILAKLFAMQHPV